MGKYQHNLTKLQTQNREQSNLIKELQSENYKLRLGSAGVGSGIEAIIEKADSDRQQYETKIKELENNLDYFASIMPIQTIIFGQKLDPAFQLPDGITSVNTVIGVSICLTNGYGNYFTLIDGKVYTGDIDAAKNDIVNAITAALDHSPSLEDLGKQHIEGLTDEEIIEICKGLSNYRYLHIGSFEDEILKTFNLVVARIEKDLEDKDISKDRNHIRTNFNQVIKRTFERYEKRRKAAIHDSVAEKKQKPVLDKLF